MVKVLTPQVASDKNRYITCFWNSVKSHSISVEPFGDGLQACDLGRLVEQSRAGNDVGDFIHFHWLKSFCQKSKTGTGKWRSRCENLLFTLINIWHLVRLKSAGYKVSWTVHNTVSHETGMHLSESIFRWSMRYLCDDVIVMSRFSQKEFARHYRRTSRVHIVPHGNYIDVYPNLISRSDARQFLGIEPQQKVLLHLGMLRPYKGINDLLAAFWEAADRNTILLVAGACWNQELRSSLDQAAALDPRIRIYLDFVPDQDIQIYMNACDWVVLPYKRILNSGSALLALSFARPVVVPQQGSLIELIQDGVQGLTYPTVEELSSSLKRALDTSHLQHQELCQNAYALAQQYDWSIIGHQLAQIFYQAKF